MKTYSSVPRIPPHTSEVAEKKLIESSNLKLVLMGLPQPVCSIDKDLIELNAPLLSRQKETSRLLDLARQTHERVSSSDYQDHLHGTLGAQPLGSSPK